MTEIDLSIMKKYQELETKVKELQEEIERLKKEEEEEKGNKLPEGFDRMYALKFLETYSCLDLQRSFLWKSTIQGHDYWHNIYHSSGRNSKYVVVSDKAIIQIQKWVILSFQGDQQQMAT